MAASEEVLSKLHDALTRDLLARIESGEATAADMAVARGLLKDNRITCLPKDDSGIGELEKKLADRKAKRPVPKLVHSAVDDVEGAREAMQFLVKHG